MPVIQRTYSGDTPTSVSLTALADPQGHTPPGVSLPVAFTVSGSTWTTSFVGTAAVYAFAYLVTWPDETTTLLEGTIAGDAPPVVGAYLTVAAADAIAATLPPALLSAYLAADDAAKGAALLQASSDVDAAQIYQGRRFDPAVQVNEFPRVPHPSRWRGVSDFGRRPTGGVWDWDPVANVAVVPPRVLQAVLYQADHLLRPQSDALAAQHEGVSSVTRGPFAESYRPGSNAATTGLCLRAYQLMDRYRLTSGGLL